MLPELVEVFYSLISTTRIEKDSSSGKKTEAAKTTEAGKKSDGAKKTEEVKKP